MILKPKNLISLILCLALILNAGCQSIQRSENTTVPDLQPVEVSNPDTQSQTEKPDYPYGAGNSIGQFITESANSAYDIAVGAAAVALIYIDVSLLCEVF